MKRTPKIKEKIIFKYNNHVVEVTCIMRPLYSVNAKSHDRKTCWMLFSHDDGTITTMAISNMNAAVHYIVNNLDLNTLDVNVFGNNAKLSKTILQRNLRWYIINSIDGKLCET